MKGEKHVRTDTLLSLAVVLAAACSDTTPKVETETHFLRACSGSCEDGLSCSCGVCTEPCSEDNACSDRPGTASCETSSCGHIASTWCDVTCSAPSDCAALGEAFTCMAGRCREQSGVSGSGGAGGEAGAGGQGESGGVGGQSGAGASGGTGGGGDDAGAIDAGPFDAGSDSSVGAPCDALGETCCDPFPQDGPNYCDNARLRCGANNTCEINCECVLGAYVPVCGVDGETYDATCGDECVSVAIACRGQCPCAAGTCDVQCTGAAPEQTVVDACRAITEMTECQTFMTGGFPSNCRWVTPGDTCPPFP